MKMNRVQDHKQSILLTQEHASSTDRINTTTTTTKSSSNIKSSSSSSMSSSNRNASSCLPSSFWNLFGQQGDASSAGEEGSHDNTNSHPPARRKSPPPPHHLPEEADQYLEREMAALSVEQRERIQEEIHGILPEEFKEDPAHVAECLLQMEEEILKVRNRAAYNRAHFLNPTLVTRPAFRIMFLRYARFVPRLAAQRIIAHFKYKLELFGEEKVATPITQADLTDDEQEALRTGALQPFPCGTDTVGRPVFFVLTSGALPLNMLDALHAGTNSPWTAQTFARIIWYQMMSALQTNEMVQRRGVVYVCYEVEQAIRRPTKFLVDLARKTHMLRDGIPLRLASYHYCYSNVAVRPAMAMLRAVAGTDFRLRFRDHFGSYQEVQYALMTFGITEFPVEDGTGQVVHSFFGNLIDTLKQQEEEEKERERADHRIVVATNRDVLLGKGWSCQNHPANLVLAKMIEDRQGSYHQATKFDKVCTSWEIVRLVQQDMGGRFLKLDEATGFWEQVSDEAAREKVANGFRSNKKQRVRGLKNSAGGDDDDDDGLPTIRADAISSSDKRLRLD